MSATITIKGFDELMVRLDKLKNTRAIFQPAMGRALEVLRQEASRFPPQPNRMRSGRLNTWVREVGQLTSSQFGLRKSGKVEVLRAPKGGRVIIRQSEKMIQQWKQATPEYIFNATSLIGRLVNKASYAHFVQGEDQVKWHAETGWKTTRTIEQEQAARITRIFNEAVRAYIKH
mgnify:CR=1 FL=1